MRTINLKAEYPEIGVCGLSCRLCPAHHRETVSKCEGCKTQSRMTVGCALSNCAIKKKSAEFCWLCGEEKTCERWKRHRELGKQHDSFVSYIRLEDNISSVQEHGVEEFEKQQKRRESLLITMLKEYDEGRSKTYYCIAASVLDVPDLEVSLEEARKQAGNLETKEKAIVLHGILDRFAARKKCYLKLRK